MCVIECMWKTGPMMFPVVLSLNNPVKVNGQTSGWRKAAGNHTSRLFSPFLRLPVAAPARPGRKEIRRQIHTEKLCVAVEAKMGNSGDTAENSCRQLSSIVADCRRICRCPSPACRCRNRDYESPRLCPSFCAIFPNIRT